MSKKQLVNIFIVRTSSLSSSSTSSFVFWLSAVRFAIADKEWVMGSSTCVVSEIRLNPHRIKNGKQSGGIKLTCFSLRTVVCRIPPSQPDNCPELVPHALLHIWSCIAPLPLNQHTIIIMPRLTELDSKLEKDNRERARDRRDKDRDRYRDDYDRKESSSRRDERERDRDRRDKDDRGQGKDSERDRERERRRDKGRGDYYDSDRDRDRDRDRRDRKRERSRSRERSYKKEKKHRDSRSPSPSSKTRRKEAKAAAKAAAKREAELEQSRALAELSMYSATDNPFHDANLGEQFQWHKKRDKEKKAGLTAEEIARKDALRRQEAKEELERLNKRRADREVEMQLREEEETRQRRLAEDAAMAEWIAKEDDFQLEQSRRRAGIRLRERRAKAIDFLAINLRFTDPKSSHQTAAIGALTNPRASEVEREEEEEGWGWADAGFEFEIDEPWKIFENLTLDDCVELEQDIKMYLSLEKSPINIEFWQVSQ